MHAEYEPQPYYVHINFVELLDRIYPETPEPSVNTSKEIIYLNQNEPPA